MVFEVHDELQNQTGRGSRALIHATNWNGFVLSRKSHVNRDQILQVAPNMWAEDEDDWLKEFVRTNNPYEVLQNCFQNLQELVEKGEDCETGQCNTRGMWL